MSQASIAPDTPSMFSSWAEQIRSPRGRGGGRKGRTATADLEHWGCKKRFPSHGPRAHPSAQFLQHPVRQARR